MLGDICNHTYRPLMCKHIYRSVQCVYVWPMMLLCDLWYFDVYVYAVLNSCVSGGGVLCVYVCMMCIRMIGLPEPEGRPESDPAVRSESENCEVHVTMCAPSSLHKLCHMEQHFSLQILRKLLVTDTHAHYWNFISSVQWVMTRDPWLLFVWKQHLELKGNWLHASIKNDTSLTKGYSTPQWNVVIIHLPAFRSKPVKASFVFRTVPLTAKQLTLSGPRKVWKTNVEDVFVWCGWHKTAYTVCVQQILSKMSLPWHSWQVFL